MSKFEEKQLARKLIYDGFISLYEDQVELPNKNTSSRLVIEHPGAAAVLPVFEDETILLVRQYRYPCKQEFLEIPAGKKDRGEDGLTCVTRELEEETGYKAREFHHLVSIATAIGFCDEVIDIFFATGIEKVENPMQADEDEFVENVFIQLDEAYQMILDGQITDSKTIVAIQSYILNQKKLS